jgi:trigger factor
MKVLERKNENHQEIFKIELEKPETDKAMDLAYEHLLKEVKIDGFRKGKAPREVLEAKIGKDAIFDEAMKLGLPEVVDNLLVENKIRAYATPLVRVQSREPVVFEAVVPLPPVIELGDYNAIKMQPNPVDIKDEAVEDILERARHQAADWCATGTAAEMNDMVVMDVESNIGDQPYIIEQGVSFQLQPGWHFPVPGFGEQLVGVKAGEEKEFSIKIPDEFLDKSKAGKEAHFKVKVTDVQREHLPEMNNEFATKVAPGSQSIEKLREAVKEDLRRRAQETENKAFEEKVIDALVDKSKIEYPPLLADSEIDRMVREYIDRMRNSTQNEEEFDSLMKMTSEEKLRDSFRPEAEQRVRRNLVISKVVEAEKMEASESEIDQQIASITAEAGNKVQEQTTYLNKPENRDTLRWWLATDKARKLLVDKAKSGEAAADKSSTEEPKAETP